MKLVVTAPEKVDTFKVIFQNIKSVADDVVIRFDKQGLHIQGMDGSMCCCFELRLTRVWFDTFEDEDKEFHFGINSNILQTLLSVHKPNQNVILTVGPESDTLDISFTGAMFDTHFTIPLMDIDQDLMNFSPYESDVDLTIESDILAELVSKLKQFADRASIHFTDESVTMTAKGVEGSMKTDITADNVIEYAIGEGVEFRQEYSLEFLALMGTFKKLNSEFAMKFQRERPLEGQYKIDEGSYMTFFLAPKISIDDGF